MDTKKTVSQQISESWPGIMKELEWFDSHSREEVMDEHLVSITKQAMEEKLEIARNKGRGGWWKDDCSTASLKAMLVTHVTKGDMRDVMNIAAMIYFRESVGIETNTLNGSKGE